jgi:hypothetical protein
MAKYLTFEQQKKEWDKTFQYCKSKMTTEQMREHIRQTNPLFYPLFENREFKHGA